MKITLPQEFKDRMKQQLGEEYDAFLSSYEREGFYGLRVNTSKISVEEFLKITPFELTPVPWTENGFYYQKEDAVTKHPHYFAGLYYIQEPSAMLPASRLPVQPGELVLDLCAAPGGKATELSSRLGGDGLLVANDASASRAKALLKNMTVWGCSNGCITAETPEKLLETFGMYFDKILVDAPCSGEGMFRRDSSLAAAWCERGPKYYSVIQREILSCAVQMLKPGGMLLYSTCTFSAEEDENVIAWLLKEFPELALSKPARSDGLSRAAAPFEDCLRVWPHRTDGEGHFLALLKKQGSCKEREKSGLISPEEVQKSHRNMPDEVVRFLGLLPEKSWKNRVYLQIGDQCFLLPPYRIPKRLRYLRTGILIGTLKKGRFEPDQALAMTLKLQDFPLVHSFASGDVRTFRYLKGETVELQDSEMPAKNGWMLIGCDGYPLGWAKHINGNLRNKYYPGWRVQ